MAAHHCWWNDVFLNLYFDDQLWAHMIRGAEWLCVVDWTKINNASLLLLLRMGVLDWKAPNNRLHQATQVIRHGTTVTLRLLPRIMKLESRVRRVIRRRLKSSNTLLYRWMMLRLSGELIQHRSVVSRLTLRSIIRRF